jgi:transcriptional regulator with XRE-family HTH domain
MGYGKDEVLQKHIGLLVKKLREQKNLTQLELYHDTNIKISRVESGKTNISLNTISVLCKHFGLTLGEFFTMIDKNEW